MADSKISALTTQISPIADTDLFTIIDVSDLTMAATGTNKKVLSSLLKSEYGISGTPNFVPKYNSLGTALTSSLIYSSSAGVAINDNAPSTMFDVVSPNPTRGIISALKNNAGATLTGSQLLFNQNTIGNWVVGQPASVSAFAFWVGRSTSTDGTEVLRILSTGKVGINTTNPSNYLSIVTPSSQYAFGITNATFTANEANGVRLSQGNAGDASFENNATEFMRVTSNLKLGFNSATPLAYWHFKYTYGNIDTTSGIMIENTSAGGGAVTGLHFRNSGGAATETSIWLNSPTNNSIGIANSVTYYSLNHSFHSNVTNALMMVIDSNKNVGIGTKVFGTGATNLLAIAASGEPTTAPTDTLQIYSIATADTTHSLGIKVEQAVVTEVVSASHTLKVRINGTDYKILLSSGA